MHSRRAKYLFASTVLLASFGCGADPTYHRSGRSNVIGSEPRMVNRPSPEAPAETIAELQGCVDQYAPGLSADSYAILVDIEAAKSGKVTSVKVKDSMIAGSALEACVTNVLEHMAVPASATNARNEVSRDSRSMVGVVQVVAAPVALAPIALVAAGVTILVGVTIYLGAEALNEHERCKKVREMCIAKCTEETIPTGTFNGDPFFKCRRRCMEAENCW